MEAALCFGEYMADDYSSSNDTKTDMSDPSKGDSRWKDKAKAAGRSLASSGQDTMNRAQDQRAASIGPVQYSRGGKVRKTGLARIHKGERVIPRSKVKKVERLMKRNKMRMKSSGRG
jgi:hypothetical protein